MIIEVRLLSGTFRHLGFLYYKHVFVHFTMSVYILAKWTTFNAPFLHGYRGVCIGAPLQNFGSGAKSSRGPS